MASYEQRGSRVRAHVTLKGVRVSETFESKAAARAWVTRTENEIIAGARGEIPDKLFGDALRRYLAEVPADRKGAPWERLRVAKTLRDPIALVHLRDLSSAHVAEWRDRGLKGDANRKPIKGASVRREWNLLSYVCSVAIGEWKWLKLNPFSKAAGAKRPKNSPHRKELILEADFAALQAAADSHSTQTQTYRQVMRAARFGVETAMRSGEIIFLGHNPERVDLNTRVAHLPYTKNGNARDVGLSLEAIRLWNEAVAQKCYSCVWGLTDKTRDAYWRDLRERAAAQHPPVRRLHFHDTRHTAITRLAKKLAILDLARMAGITDLKILMTYYNETAADIARKLD